MSNSATSGAMPAAQQQQQQRKSSSGKRRSVRPAPAAAAAASEAEAAETELPAAAKQGGDGGGPLKKGTRARSGQNDKKNAAAPLMGPAFSKSAFVFVVAALLVAGLWNHSNKTRPPDVSTTAIQVKELEDFSKRTTKWMQVQLEIVDMKIGEQVLQLRKDMVSKLEERAMSLEAGMNKLEAKLEETDSSLHKLMSQGLLTKGEAMELMQSMISRQKEEEEASRVVTLDDVRFAARQIVEAELERHSADGIARVDYALRSGGGKVVDHSEAIFQGVSGSGQGASWLDVLASGLSAGGSVRHPMADKVIQPSFGEPGECLPLKGSNVFVDIALRTRIFPRAITLEHVSKSVAYDVTSAPKEFTLLGWMQSSGSRSSSNKSNNKVVLGEFVFNMDGPSVQTFQLEQVVQEQVINTVRLQVKSNHGNPWHTCIYRIRVHGIEPTLV